MGVATPSRRVLATALRPPLQLSHSVLEFHLPSGYFELGIESGAGRAQVSLLQSSANGFYYMAELVQDEKEYSDWFPEQSAKMDRSRSDFTDLCS